MSHTNIKRVVSQKMVTHQNSLVRNNEFNCIDISKYNNKGNKYLRLGFIIFCNLPICLILNA